MNDQRPMPPPEAIEAAPSKVIARLEADGVMYPVEVRDVGGVTVASCAGQRCAGSHTSDVALDALRAAVAHLAPRTPPTVYVEDQ